MEQEGTGGLGRVNRVVRTAVGLEAIHLTVSGLHVHVVHPLHVHWLSRIIRALKSTGRSRRHLARLRRRVHVRSMRTTRKQATMDQQKLLTTFESFSIQGNRWEAGDIGRRRNPIAGTTNVKPS